ncbi:MAG TPA: choice-of-anchor tandem repeat GloVer-containing protein [Candidatus Cybelea sp.]|nr:choice-of-anchor tandem repeat GloVer-containing protein [Candidatus Cybelea sp.]
MCIIILTGCSSMPATSSLPAASRAAAGRTTSGNFQVLHAFSASKDGKVPVGTLLAVNGTLYGTTNFGGDPDKSCYPGIGCGTVFSLTGKSDEGVIYRFTGPAAGTRPYAGLIDVNGTFYGTTQTGGKSNEGVVYSLTPSGSEHVVFAFKDKTGNDPRAGLTSVNGTIYGTTYYGGAAGTGSVFTVTPSGTEKVLHSFQAGSGDGSLPLGILLSYNSMLYGTTSSGGTGRAGTVFQIKPDGSGYSVLYNFKGGKSDGAFPFAGLTELNGTLYGTTQEGGAHNKGTVFAITTSGSESLLHSFGAGTDGSEPFAGLTVLSGQLYGATAYGGTTGQDIGPNVKRKPTSEGTIYTITPSGSEQVVHNFSGGPGGRVPYANLTALNGSLYGVTIWGGNKKGPKGGVGTIFEYTP